MAGLTVNDVMDWRYDKLMAIIASQQLFIGEIIEYRLHCGFEELLGFAYGDLPEWEGDSWTANKK